MKQILGLDLGTSALKGLLFDEGGNLLASADSAYPLDTPQAGYSEQNPNHWQKAAEIVMTKLLDLRPDMKDALVGISFSGQMHSLVLLDDANQVIRPAILWNDVRTTKECQEIMATFGDQLLTITKNVALEGFTLPKIRWVQKNEPANWEKVAHVMLPKDYLAFWLTGRYSMDYSDAAGTLLLDVEEKVWSAAILKQFDIDEAVLPTLHESAGLVGKIVPELQLKFGFTQEVAIFAGGADNACAALGAGIIKEGLAMASIGTSGVFLSYEADETVDYQGKLHLFNHSVKDKLYGMGVTLAAGNSLSWFRDTFAPEEDFATLLADVGTVAAGSDGLLFTPYIVGERTPYSDAKIRGSFIGIDTHHRLRHFGRAVLEGITFSLKDSQQIMADTTGRHFKQIVSVGGGAKNPDWLQMQADIFDAEILTLTTEQGPGMGAAMLAAIGAGLFPDAESCAEVFVHYDKHIMPDPQQVAKYAKIYEIYQDVYPQTAPICHRLLTEE